MLEGQALARGGNHVHGGVPWVRRVAEGRAVKDERRHLARCKPGETRPVVPPYKGVLAVAMGAGPAEVQLGHRLAGHGFHRIAGDAGDPPDDNPLTDHGSPPLCWRTGYIRADAEPIVCGRRGLAT
jgi:hypothetical protein